MLFSFNSRGPKKVTTLLGLFWFCLSSSHLSPLPNEHVAHFFYDELAIASIGARIATAMAEFNSHLSPPPSLPASKVAAAPESHPGAAVRCDAQKCPWWPYSSSKDFKANTALIIVVLLCALTCALAFNAGIRYIVRLHCRRRRREEGEIDKGVPDPGLSYAEGMKLAGEETECIICLADFAVGEKIRVLDKCNHGFHLNCIQKWLISHSSCPTCRTNCSTPSPP